MRPEPRMAGRSEGAPPDEAWCIGDEVGARYTADALASRGEGLEDVRSRILVGVCEVGGVRLGCIYDLHQAEATLDMIQR